MVSQRQPSGLARYEVDQGVIGKYKFTCYWSTRAFRVTYQRTAATHSFAGMLTRLPVMSGANLSGRAAREQHPRTRTHQPAPVQVHAIEVHERPARRTTLYAARTAPQSKPRLSRNIQLSDYGSSASEMALDSCCRHAGCRRAAYLHMSHPSDGAMQAVGGRCDTFAPAIAAPACEGA